MSGTRERERKITNERRAERCLNETHGDYGDSGICDVIVTLINHDLSPECSTGYSPLN